MGFFSPVIAGVVLIVVGFVAAKVYHEWWLSERDWSGDIFGASSSGNRFDRVIGWLAYVGVLLIASALLWKFIGLIVSLF